MTDTSVLFSGVAENTCRLLYSGKKQLGSRRETWRGRKHFWFFILHSSMSKPNRAFLEDNKKLHC